MENNKPKYCIYEFDYSTPPPQNLLRALGGLLSSSSVLYPAGILIVGCSLLSPDFSLPSFFNFFCSFHGFENGRNAGDELLLFDFDKYLDRSEGDWAGECPN